MPITKSSRDLVDETMEEIHCHPVADVVARMNDPHMQLVDIRDIRELVDGTAVGAFHAPRGMLEFWVDPASPYYKPFWRCGHGVHPVLRPWLAQRTGYQSLCGTWA